MLGLTNIATMQDYLRLVLPANSGSSDPLALPDNSLAEPSGDGIIRVPQGANLAYVEFIGTDAADEAFDCLIAGGSEIRSGVDSEWGWAELITVTATLGSMTGATGGVVDDSNLYADTIAKKSGDDAKIVSPGNNGKA